MCLELLFFVLFVKYAHVVVKFLEMEKGLRTSRDSIDINICY